MTLFFTSDLHVGHKNIITYSNRPFSSVEEMDEAIINNWNSIVTDKDEVWNLGDFSFHNYENTKNILKRLKGKKHFIWGNHDQIFEKNKDLLGYFSSVQHYKELKINGKKLVLFHFPIATWNKGHRGSYHLCGHSHGSMNHWHEKTTSLDVGVDNFSYNPVSFEEVDSILSKKSYNAIDHHTTLTNR